MQTHNSLEVIYYISNYCRSGEWWSRDEKCRKSWRMSHLSCFPCSYHEPDPAENLSFVKYRDQRIALINIPSLLDIKFGFWKMCNKKYCIRNLISDSFVVVLTGPWLLCIPLSQILHLQSRSQSLCLL